jgi:hypothetical protein
MPAELEVELIKHQVRQETSKLILGAVEEIRTILNRLAEDCHRVYDDASAHLEAAEAELHNGVRS